jgi:hypothetical protein
MMLDLYDDPFHVSSESDIRDSRRQIGAVDMARSIARLSSYHSQLSERVSPYSSILYFYRTFAGDFS